MKDFKVKLMMHFELVAQHLHPLFDVQANSGIATALIFVTAVLQLDLSSFYPGALECSAGFLVLFLLLARFLFITVLLQLSLNLTWHRCVGIYCQQFGNLAAGPSLSGKIFLPYVVDVSANSLLSLGRVCTRCKMLAICLCLREPVEDSASALLKLGMHWSSAVVAFSSVSSRASVQTSARGSVHKASFSSSLRMPSPICSSSKLLSELSSWSVVRHAFVEAHTTQSIACFLSHSAAFFLGLRRLEDIVPQPRVHCCLIFWPEFKFCCAVKSIGQRLMNDFAVWYLMSHAV